MSVYPLVYQQPQQCFCALAIVQRAWLDGLTDRVEVHQSVSSAPLTWVLTPGRSLRAFQEEDFLTGYEAAPAMRRPASPVHARLSQTASTCSSLTSGIPREMREHEIACSMIYTVEIIEMCSTL